MKVKDLIEKLKLYPQDQTVVFGTSSTLLFNKGDVFNIDDVIIHEFDSDTDESENLVETCFLLSESVYSSCF